MSKIVVTKRYSDRIQTPVLAVLNYPTLCFCPPAPKPLRPPTEAARALGRFSVIGLVRRGDPIFSLQPCLICFLDAHRGIQGGIALQKVAQSLGHGEHPLSYWQPWKNVVGQMGCGLGHAACVARGTHAVPFAGKGDEEAVAAFVTVGAGETVG